MDIEPNEVISSGFSSVNPVASSTKLVYDHHLRLQRRNRLTSQLYIPTLSSLPFKCQLDINKTEKWNKYKTTE